MPGVEAALEALKANVGREIGVADWFTVSQEDVDTFARVTDDMDPIHNDPEWARNGPYGGTIANGFFTLSLLGKFSRQIGLPGGTSDAFIALNYGLDKTRFIAPVPVGGRIRDRVVLDGIEERADGKLLLRTTDTIEIEGEARPAMVARFLIMLVPRDD